MNTTTNTPSLAELLHEGGVEQSWLGETLLFKIQSDGEDRKVALESLPIEIIDFDHWSLTESGFVLAPQTLHPNFVDNELLYDRSRGQWRLACWPYPDLPPIVYYGTIAQTRGGP